MEEAESQEKAEEYDVKETTETTNNY